MSAFHPIEIFAVPVEKFRKAFEEGPMGLDALEIDKGNLPKRGDIYFLISNNCFHRVNNSEKVKPYHFEKEDMDDFLEFLTTESKRSPAIDLVRESYENGQIGCVIIGVQEDGTQIGEWIHCLSSFENYFLLDPLIRALGKKVDKFDCPE